MGKNTQFSPDVSIYGLSGYVVDILTTLVNGTVPMYFVKKMASGLVPILACETVKFRIAHTVLKCPALCPMSLAS